MDKERYERFTFFDNWGEIFEELDDGGAAALIRAMYRYAFYNLEPEFEKGSVLSLTWKAIRPNIDSSGKAASSGSRKGKTKQPSEGVEKAPSEAPSKQKKGKEREGKGIEGEKNLPLEEDSSPVASGGAAAAVAAPAEAPICPRCGSGTMATASKKGSRKLFLCPDCFEEVWE